MPVVACASPQTAVPMPSLHSLDDSDVEGAGARLVDRPWSRPWRRGARGARGSWAASAGSAGPSCSKSTTRLARLAVVCLLCPAALLGWPLYMRYFALRDLAVPLAPSDVRVLDLHVSTAWCQAQQVRANGSFNAWMLGRRPRRGGRRHVSMVRDIRLGDDAKEYWGFYLLEGSVVTVSPCARWPGASLVVIRGYDHLLQCAYIGDDSSEEAEEVRRVALRRQLEENRRLNPRQPVAAEVLATSASVVSSSESSPRPRSNLPHRMHVVKEAVELHEKTRPPPRLYNTLHWDQDDEAEAGAEDGAPRGSAEVARGLLEQLRALGGTGQRALERLRAARLRRDLADEGGNTAAEVDAVAAAWQDGSAVVPGEDVHGYVNETTSLDESHSELWSSFSSSEEALLGCAGLVLNLPLTPHRQCQQRWPTSQLGEAAAANVVTYRVPTDGHYFFVLGSENEVQTNFVRVRFDLDKVVYDIDDPLAECDSEAGGSVEGGESCSLPLRFLSDDTLVLEVPVESVATDHAHRDHVLAVSTCQPRTALYAACVLALPAIVLTCAF